LKDWKERSKRKPLAIREGKLVKTSSVKKTIGSAWLFLQRKPR